MHCTPGHSQPPTINILLQSNSCRQRYALNTLGLSLSSDLPPNIRKPFLRGCFLSCKHEETQAKRLSLGLFLGIKAKDQFLLPICSWCWVTSGSTTRRRSLKTPDSLPRKPPAIHSTSGGVGRSWTLSHSMLKCWLARSCVGSPRCCECVSAGVPVMPRRQCC